MPDLIVYPNSELVIDKNTPIERIYDYISIGTGAKITAKCDLVLQALVADFGDGALIDATGRTGSNGADQGQNRPAVAVQGATGGRGADGGDGGDATNGFSVTITAGLRRVGNLTIDTRGGNGGNGGIGQPGGQGGGATCAGGNGGNGGPGGDGGRGGDGGFSGNVTVRWSKAPAAALAEFDEDVLADKAYWEHLADANNGVGLAAAPLGHNYVTNGGKGGSPGASADGGGGGDGVNCVFYSRGGGNHGPHGNAKRRGFDRPAGIISMG